MAIFDSASAFGSVPLIRCMRMPEISSAGQLPVARSVYTFPVSGANQVTFASSSSMTM